MYANLVESYTTILTVKLVAYGLKKKKGEGTDKNYGL